MKQAALTAALSEVGEFGQMQTGNGLNDLAGRTGYLGLKSQVTRVMVNHGTGRLGSYKR